MSDLKWQDVLNKLPANAIAVVSGKVMIDVGLVTGDSLTALTQAGVTEFALKFLIACSDAQTVYNASANIGSRLNAFPSPTFGSSVYDSTLDPPGFATTMSATCQGKIPLNINSAQAPLN